MNKRLVFALVVSSFFVMTLQAGPPAGWRGDATGRYFLAKPPLVWSLTNNVVWKTKLQPFSNATPLLLKNRLIVCSEPSVLVCLDAGNGQILWQTTNTYANVLAPAELEQARAVYPNLDAAPQTHNANGYTTATPVTDGERVYMVFGNGVAVCYDLDGKLVWARLVERPNHQWGHSASPVLAGKILLVHVSQMTALDAITGKTLWSTPTAPGWGTAGIVRVGDVDVVVTPKGHIMRVADGVNLARGVSQLTYSAPLVEGNTVYFIENGGKAIRLPDKISEPFTVETLWQTRPASDRYYASPVFYRDRIYAVHQQGLFSIIDATTGAVLAEHKLALGGTVYPSVTLAGHFLFVSSDSGVTMVFDLNDECKQVARNTLEPFRSSPVFDGSRLYIRTLAGVFCIGK